MEDLVKLVEAVKLVDTSEVVDGEAVPDGRIWAEGVGIDLGRAVGAEMDTNKGENGQELLKHAKKTWNGMYLVENARTK